MGMFDTIEVPCPKCGELWPFQTKSGECVLGDYTLENAPLDARTDVNRHAPVRCLKCGAVFEVDTEKWVPVIVDGKAKYEE